MYQGHWRSGHFDIQNGGAQDRTTDLPVVALNHSQLYREKEVLIQFYE